MVPTINVSSWSRSHSYHVCPYGPAYTSHIPTLPSHTIRGYKFNIWWPWGRSSMEFLWFHHGSVMVPPRNHKRTMGFFINSSFIVLHQGVTYVLWKGWKLQLIWLVLKQRKKLYLPSLKKKKKTIFKISEGTSQRVTEMSSGESCTSQRKKKEGFLKILSFECENRDFRFSDFDFQNPTEIPSNLGPNPKIENHDFGT